ncbi:MAG: hypothetical protein E7260_06440 [Lachnospiraceae bacterium]|nr:hypothetical protein [Lachnospiraceae bacterium]
MTKPADIQEVLKRIDPLILLKKIAEFRKLNVAQMTDEEISSAIYDVLCWEGVFACYTNTRIYPAGTKFFKVKKLIGSQIPNERFGEYPDYWETNPKYLKSYGRLNKPGESLLYVSPDLNCSVDEVRITESDFFAAIQYTAKRDIKVNLIGGEFDYDQMEIYDEKVKLIHEMYNGFLRDEFSRDVGKGTEYLYRVSERIAKDFFDLPPRIMQDAWAYTSVQDKKKYNVCFRPEIAHELLELNGAMICKRDATKQIRVFCIASGRDEEDKILFYKMGSNMQKEVFPELLCDSEINE